MLTKQLLKDRNFLLLMGYQLFVGVAEKMFQFSIPLLVFDLTQSATQMVFTFGVTMVPCLIFGFFGGTLADYFNKRTVLLLITFFSALTLITFSVGLIGGTSVIDLEIIYILCFLVATWNALDFSAFDTSIVDYFEKDSLISVNSTIEVIFSICNVAGPLLAGSVIVFLGAKYSILTIGFLYVIAFGFIIGSKPIRQSSACKKFGSIGEFIYEHSQFIKDGFAYVFRDDSPILLGITMTFLSNLIFGTKDILIIFLARASLEMTPESLGIIISMGTICSIIFIVCFAYKLRKLNTFLMMAGLLFIESFASISMGLFHTKIIILSAYCLTILTESLYNIFGTTFRQTYVSPSHVGRVAGISRSFARSATALSAIISGALLEFISVNSYFIIGGLITASISGMSYYLQKRLNPSIFKMHV